MSEVPYTDPRRCLCVSSEGDRCTEAAVTEDGLCGCCAADIRDRDRTMHAATVPFGTVTPGRQIWSTDDLVVPGPPALTLEQMAEYAQRKSEQVWPAGPEDG